MFEMIKARAELLKLLRQFFDDRGFFEVQPPCLASDCVVDAYIDPIIVDSRELGLPLEPDRMRFYLQSSPEAAMKRMLAEGAPSIYSIGPVYRAGECGPLHNPEFIMLEWYDLHTGIDAEIELVRTLAAQTLNCQSCDVITYEAAFHRYLSIDPLETELSELVRLVSVIDRDLAESIQDDRDALLDVLISERIQPELGNDVPIVLRNYPATQAALARVLESDARYAARFELYYRGVELANGYDELLDPDELVRRAHESNEKRRLGGRETLRTETKLVEAMRQGMPASSGVALGVDRLLMLRMNKNTLADVMPFPIDQV